MAYLYVNHAFLRHLDDYVFVVPSHFEEYPVLVLKHTIVGLDDPTYEVRGLVI